MEKPILEKATFTLIQEGNCVGSTQDIETLTIDFESSLGLDIDEDGYFVLKTDGWSVENVQDLQEMFDRIKGILFSRRAKNLIEKVSIKPDDNE